MEAIAVIKALLALINSPAVSFNSLNSEGTQRVATLIQQASRFVEQQENAAKTPDTEAEDNNNE